MTTKKLALAAALAAVSVVGLTGVAEARQQIRIVGSSTVFPFTATVVERFGQTTSFPAPILESTGTGGGMRLFCAGVGADHPDITGASRAMKASEFDQCQKNGVEEVTEIMIGFDGIAFAHAKSGPDINLTKAQLWQALAKEVEVNGQIVPNPHKRWSDVDPSLPNAPIEVLGPPPTSGTRDAWVELVMDTGCEEYPAVKSLAAARKKAVCQTMREDGVFIEAGENDNLIVQRLEQNKDAYGIFGFSYLEENLDKLKGATISGVTPSFETIASGEYPISRPLFIYLKNAHVGVIPGLKEFVTEYVGERAAGEDGYLADKGLVAMPKERLAKVQETVKSLTPMAKPAS
ncbi:PstS family phosphate ABC transporter substrate-binding protein [Rhodospirillum centenum]|uniref:Phosphate ABC transporter, periplasmic phosphate-binding protein PstS, putative n=1 Tax=Rhodospirillum centenum (strain ATCC 51521 / SW) TaxID=414684 RepID=B6IWF0_RHOCS|nr:PstS family phosphate ABC transporter substrate-binding protein [Rhodospirillum centenum]ACJ00624.1 phosphate ABC transporter, periplasmic phosphate-binding protein PstS, putative [Rhodospirillum centenum SW]